MGVATEPQIDARYRDLEGHFATWEKIKDCIDQNIDVFENYRQSGHPGGSRSKAHMLVYSMLAVYNTALQAKYARTQDPRYLVPNAEERQLVWRDLLGFRRNKGLAGHAEMEGKTLFLKFNTGPSGHGSPPAAGEAMALKRAGAEGVKVFAVEGEGGLTTGATHETKNSAFGLGLDNLHYLIDWNDWGIDEVPTSRI